MDKIGYLGKLLTYICVIYQTKTPLPKLRNILCLLLFPKKIKSGEPGYLVKYFFFQQQHGFLHLYMR